MVEFSPAGSGQKYISPAQIKKMKENMQKVPLIHQKSEAFHQRELLKAEIAFEQAQKKIISNEPKSVIKEKIVSGKKKIPQKRRKARWKKVIKKYIKRNKI